MKLMLSAPAPDNQPERDELSSLSSSLEGDYGKGKYCRETKEPRAARGDGAPQAKRLERGEGPPRLSEAKQQCLDINGASNILSSSGDPKELADVWEGWQRVGAPMRDRYTRFAELSNKGARELGFADRRVVAIELRHAARRIRRGRSPVDTGAAAVPVTAHIRALEAGAQIRRGGSAGQRHTACASPRQHVAMCSHAKPGWSTAQ